MRLFITLFSILAISEVFAQNPIPLITSFQPLSAHYGDTVVFTGKNFSGSTSQNIVRFGGVNAKVITSDSSKILATVPKGAQYGTVEVVVKGLSAVSPSFFVPLFPNDDTLNSGTFTPRTDRTAGLSPSNIALGDLDRDGLLDVVVTNDGSAVVSIFQNISSGKTIIVSAAVHIGVGMAANHAAIADIDGDGRLDILTANRGSHSISVLRNISSPGTLSASSFESKREFTVGTSPYSVFVCDLDLDGQKDVIVANNGSNSVSVFRNISLPGSISFAPRVDLPVGSAPFSAAAFDLNNDSKPEIITSNYNGNNVSILRNRTKTDFASGISFAAKIDLPTGASPAGIAVGDVNNDGKLDIVTANTVGNTITVFKCTAIEQDTIKASSFSVRQDFAVGINPMGVALGSLNGDPRVDIVVTNWNGGSISYFQNNSTSDSVILSTRISLTAGDGARGVTVGDLDLDSKPDILTACLAGNIWSIYQNNSDVPDAPKNLTAVPGNEKVTLTWYKSRTANIVRYNIYKGIRQDSLVLIDSTSGNTPDSAKTITGIPSGVLSYFAVSAVKANGSESKFSNTVSAMPFDTIPPAPPKTLMVKDSLRYYLLVTWNQNLEKDFLRYRLYGDTLQQSLQLIDSTSKGSADTLMAIDPKTNSRYFAAVTAVDIYGNESGFSNMVSSQLQSGGRPIPEIMGFSRGAGKFNDTIALTAKGFFSKNQSAIVRIGKNRANVVKSDSSNIIVKVPLGAQYGPIEIAANGYTALSTRMFLPVFNGGGNVDAGSFGQPVNNLTGSSPTSTAMGDLDGDGLLDVVVTNDANSLLLIFQNISMHDSTSFAKPVQKTIGVGAHHVILADIDGDGRLDLVTANRGAASISVVRNKHLTGPLTAASFDSAINFPVGNNPFTTACGDIDQDGRLDIVVANYYSNSVTVFKNIGYPGTIRLAPGIDFPVGSGSFTVLLHDFNRDGKPDIITSNYSSSSISLLKNTAIANSIEFSSFAPKVDLPAGNAPAGMVVGDMDGDSLNDIVVANVLGNTVSVFRAMNNSSDSVLSKFFAPKIDVPAGINPMGLALGNLNGDNTVDVVATNWNGGSIALFQNNSQPGSITLAPKVDEPAGDGARSVSIGDLNGDGRPDLAVACWPGNVWSVYNNLSGGPLSAALDGGLIPKEFSLLQNFPNPFNPSTTITYTIPVRSQVLLEVFNVVGQKIMTIVNSVQDPNVYSKDVRFTVPSGMYFYRLTATPLATKAAYFINTKPMVLIR